MDELGEPSRRALELDVAFGMRERHAHPFRTELVKPGLEADDVERRRLDQQVGATLTVGGEGEFLVAGLERPDERHLGAAHDLDLDAFPRDGLAERSTPAVELVDVNVREVRAKVRRDGERPDARRRGGPKHRDRPFRVGGTVVDPGQRVRVHIDIAEHSAWDTSQRPPD